MQLANDRGLRGRNWSAAALEFAKGPYHFVLSYGSSQTGF
jgi:ABC-type thiamine transport system substrate-binding protein